jgi:hypothetical protein
VTRQALAPVTGRGEVFAVKVGNRLYYPQAFLGMDREAVAAICRAPGDLGASEKLMFWLCEHGALAGKSVATALEAGTALAQVERLASAWARKRGASRVVAAA